MLKYWRAYPRSFSPLAEKLLRQLSTLWDARLLQPDRSSSAHDLDSVDEQPILRPYLARRGKNGPQMPIDENTNCHLFSESKVALEKTTCPRTQSHNLLLSQILIVGICFAWGKSGHHISRQQGALVMEVLVGENAEGRRTDKNNRRASRDAGACGVVSNGLTYLCGAHIYMGICNSLT